MQYTWVGFSINALMGNITIEVNAILQIMAAKVGASLNKAGASREITAR